MTIVAFARVAQPTPSAAWPRQAPARDCRDADAHPLRRWVMGFRIWLGKRETVRILSALDTATLRDLGIVDIEPEVYGDPSDRRRGYDPCWWRKR